MSCMEAEKPLKMTFALHLKWKQQNNYNCQSCNSRCYVFGIVRQWTKNNFVRLWIRFYYPRWSLSIITKDTLELDHHANKQLYYFCEKAVQFPLNLACYPSPTHLRTPVQHAVSGWWLLIMIVECSVIVFPFLSYPPPKLNIAIP